MFVALVDSEVPVRMAPDIRLAGLVLIRAEVVVANEGVMELEMFCRFVWEKIRTLSSGRKIFFCKSKKEIEKIKNVEKTF